MLFSLIRKSGVRGLFAYTAHQYILLNRSSYFENLRSFSRHLFSETDHSNRNTFCSCSKVYSKNKGSQLSRGTKTCSGKNIFTFLKLYAVFKSNYIVYTYIYLSDPFLTAIWEQFFLTPKLVIFVEYYEGRILVGGWFFFFFMTGNIDEIKTVPKFTSLKGPFPHSHEFIRIIAVLI